MKKKSALKPKITKAAIKSGTKHELEHTKSKKVAKKIAMDHLKKHGLYYSKKGLPTMEKKLTKAEAKLCKKCKKPNSKCKCK
jgi:hypothetical protein